MTSARPILLSLALLTTFATGVAHAEEQPVSRLLFGSCVKQDFPVPIFQTIVNRKPELFVFLGDNIYGDTADMDVMRAKYAKLKAAVGFDLLQRTCPVLATWDDHDYGQNDGGADFAQRDASQQVFMDFWGDRPESPRRKRPGVYEAHVYGPVGKRLQVILLDTRYFRGPLQKGAAQVGGPYVPTADETIPMLGESQWKWLRQQLEQPAEVRVICTSIQCVSESSGHETWSNLPHERKRLFNLLASTKANGVVMISGDRHWAELSVEKELGPYPIYDLTSSSLSQLHARGTPTANKSWSLPVTYHRENFGEVYVEWGLTDPVVHLRVLDMAGEVRLESAVKLSELK